MAGLPLRHQHRERLGQRQVLQGHRVQVVDQCAKALLQVIAVIFQLRHRAREQLRLVGDQTQQAGLGANTGQVLAEVIMQGLGQVVALLLLHRHQGLGQLGIVGVRLLQGVGHAVEMQRQLPRFG